MNNIFGLIPVGGKGLRLSLPFSKEMIPQKNYDYYNPLINHTVQKMEFAGANTIIFVHGSEYKKDIIDYFSNVKNQTKYIHIKQETIGFAQIIIDFINYLNNNDIVFCDNDKVILGLPDSIFDKNPFIELLELPGIACGLFTTTPYTKVDRINLENKFDIKCEKNNNNSEFFWGILKFTIKDLKIAINKVYNVYGNTFTNEIGEILNLCDIPKNNFVYGKKYLDLGTWKNYNKYLSDESIFSHTELESKYDANLINETDFNTYMQTLDFLEYYKIVSKDYYYKSNNNNIEFIRYREDSKDYGAEPDITIKNFNNSQLNRFELAIKLSKDNETNSIKELLNLIGLQLEFDVIKTCHIYKFQDYTIVYYYFEVNNKLFKILEIELNNSNFSLMEELEIKLLNINGFNPNNTIELSKYQIIKRELNNADSTYIS